MRLHSRVIELAGDRLAEGLRLVYEGAPPMDCRCVDVAAAPAGALDALGVAHGLSGPQAHRIRVSGRRVWLLGHGPLGVAYAVEKFRDLVLGIDPLAFWTGIPVERSNPALHDFDRTWGPPAFWDRIYFENDADELIHWSGRRLQMEWPAWKELIDSLLGLGFSGVQVFDSLGRSEFVEWDHYRAQARFQIDADLVARVFDYLHAKGMRVSVQMSLAWGFRRLPGGHACWSRYKDEWMAIWRHYLTETPLRDADVFAVDVNDPLWDGEDRCRCAACVALGRPALRAQVQRALADLVGALCPDRILSVGTYGQREARFESFAGRQSVAEYADRGYALFGVLPDAPAGMPCATYIHAGYWLDHMVANPYLREIGEAMRGMRDRGATTWVRINGQSFRPFLLEIAALASAAWDPDGYEPGAFVREWAGRRLGDAAVEPFALFVDAMRAANLATRTPGAPDDPAQGYVKVLLGHVYPLFHALAGRRPGEPVFFDPHTVRATHDILGSFPDLGSSLEHAQGILDSARKALAEAERVAACVPDAACRAFADAQAVFPARLFVALAELYAALVRVRDVAPVVPTELLDGLQQTTQALWGLHLSGPEHPRWREWFLPSRVRVFGLPPSPEFALWVRRRLTEPPGPVPGPVP